MAKSNTGNPKASGKWKREQPVRCCVVSKKREQPVSDPARQVRGWDQDGCCVVNKKREQPVRCCVVSKKVESGKKQSHGPKILTFSFHLALFTFH
jgi:hypothetical protein